MRRRILVSALWGLMCSAPMAQEAIGQGAIPRDTSYTVYQSLLKVRKAYPDAAPALPVLPEGATAERSIAYAVLDSTVWGPRTLHLDLFHPRKAGSYPAVVMVHGGGWRSGDRSMQHPLAMQLAANGYVTVTVEYQLSLEATYPAAVHNVKAAIRWLRANANSYGIDTSRIAISGCSAGGQLAALVGATNGISKFEGNQGNLQHSSAVQAVIDIDGVVDFLAPASLNLIRKPDAADVGWFGGTFVQKPEVWKEASPIFWVGKSTVPYLFINSGLPRFHAGQDEMVGILNQHGIYHQVHSIDVKVHPFWLFHPWFSPTVKLMVDFLNRTLKAGEPASAR